MDAKVVWHEQMSFTGSADTGFELPMDAHPSVGGNNQGFRPMELMALSLAGCAGMDVISILRKKRQEVVDFEVRVHAEQQDKHPHVFTRMEVEYIVKGRSVDPKAVERAIELSSTKYCPAQAMLGQVVEVANNYTIHEVE